jgi:hypothetical protein
MCSFITTSHKTRFTSAQRDTHNCNEGLTGCLTLLPQRQHSSCCRVIAKMYVWYIEQYAHPGPLAAAREDHAPVTGVTPVSTPVEGRRPLVYLITTCNHRLSCQI